MHRTIIKLVWNRDNHRSNFGGNLTLLMSLSGAKFATTLHYISLTLIHNMYVLMDIDNNIIKVQLKTLQR